MYYDKGDVLTHESQFAGCGEQRKQQNEKTEQNSLCSKLLLTPDAFNKKNPVQVPCSKAHSIRYPAEQEYKPYSVKSEVLSDLSLKRWPLSYCLLSVAHRARGMCEKGALPNSNVYFND